MIKHSRLFITFLLAVIAFGAKAQSSTTAPTSSPYSRYGIGDYTSPLLPQNEAMGGIATAVNRISGYNNINVLNPASYGSINFTTIDAGIYSSIITLNQTGAASSTNANFRLSHVTFAVPVTTHSALSFGLLPYSVLGYNYKQTFSKGFGTGSAVDTNAVNYIYNGEGSLSKSYIGYGYRIGKHLFVGANASYIFGNLAEYQSTEIPTLYGMLDSRIENSNAIRGFNYDYGLQYSFDFGENSSKHIILAYAASASTSLNATNTYIVSHYTYDSSGGQNISSDSTENRQGSKSNIKLPQINHFGISYQYDGHILIGADYTMGNWSTLTMDGTNAGLQNSKTFNIGGSYIPNINALRNYFARTDYRLGFIYDDSYLNLNNTTIKSYAVTFGLGLPLAPVNNTAFYKINFSAELGRRGTLDNGLVRENYVNLHLGFTINDKWFTRYRFE